MKIYACYSDSHAAFVHRHFLPSVPVGVPVDIVRMPQDCVKGRFRDKGWLEMAQRKLAMCARACSDPNEDLVFVSDVDARFYARDAESFEADLRACLGGSDIAFQWDGAEGKFCSGSWVAKPSVKLHAMFKRAIELLPKFNGFDQPAMNAAVGEFCSRIDAMKVYYTQLPERYWSHGAKSGLLWSPGMAIDPPVDLIVHQANWCIGIEPKLALLDTVLSTYNDRMSRKMADVLNQGASKEGCPVVFVPPSDPRVSTRVPLMFETEDAPPKPSKEPRLVRSPMSEATERAEGHVLNPPALVLQFWEHDKREACALAKLIADIEPRPRRDVPFIFAPQQGTVLDADVEKAMAYVGRKFSYRQIWTQYDPRKTYPGVCFDPWASAVDQLARAHARGDLFSGSAFFFESDGCPARVDWIDRLTEAHNMSLDAGRWFTGPVMRGDYFDQHMNGSLIMWLRAWYNLPSLHECPADQAWDIWHGREIVAHGRDTRAILNEYGITLTRPLFEQLGREAAWISSVKDGTSQFWARKLLVEGRQG